jgi:hypothetical protein
LSDSIYLLNPDETLHEVTRSPYAREDLLQELLERYPQLIPGSLINPEEPVELILVKREVGVPKEEGGSGWWSADHLFLDQLGVPTIVEVKRASDTRARREVVAQMLDYVANAVVYWDAGDIRRWFETGQQMRGHDPAEALTSFIAEAPVQSVEEFWAKVDANLKA